MTTQQILNWLRSRKIIFKTGSQDEMFYELATKIPENSSDAVKRKLLFEALSKAIKV